MSEDKVIKEIEIESATKEHGNDGNSYWQLRFFAPGITNKYSIPARIPGNYETEIVKGNKFRVVLERGNLKDGKDGKYQTDYWWNITQWRTEASEFQQPYTPENTPAPRPESPRESQRWEDKPRHEREGARFGMLFNRAVDLWLHDGEAPAAFAHYFHKVMEWEHTAIEMFNDAHTPEPPQQMQTEAETHATTVDGFDTQLWMRIAKEQGYTGTEIKSLLGMTAKEYVSQYPDTTPEELRDELDRLRDLEAMGAPREEV